MTPSRVLVVDGERPARKLVVRVLHEDGYLPEVAGSCDEDMAGLDRTGLAAVVCAAGAPGAEGPRLLEQVRSADDAVPFVVVAETAGLEGAADLLRRGADDLLVEPFTAEQVREVLRRAMEKGRRRRLSREQHARLEHLYQVKSRFLASMSHELRTPLTTIIGMSEVLGEGLFGELGPRQRRYVATIEQSAKHLLGLINDILDFSKLEAGKMTLELADFTAAEVVATACTIVGGQALRKGIRLETGGDVPATTLRGDRGKVVQVLVNLLSNAIKFSPEGSAVRVRCEVDDRWSRFAVEDRGIGIPRDALETIFGEFQQVRGGASGKDPGTGLGLALSRRLARLHGGDVQVTSVVGEGSRFVLSLPLQAEPASDEAPALAGAVDG